MSYNDVPHCRRHEVLDEQGGGEPALGLNSDFLLANLSLDKVLNFPKPCFSKMILTMETLIKSFQGYCKDLR